MPPPSVPGTVGVRKTGQPVPLFKVVRSPGAEYNRRMLLLRFALWAFVFFLVIRIIGHLLRASFHFEIITPQSHGNRRSPPGGGAPGRAAADMVQDPACGAWVAADQAVKANVGATTQFFCSQQCLDTYRKKLNG